MSDRWEAKAREWLYWRDKTKSTDIDSLVALLRSVDAEARREEAEEWERDAELAAMEVLQRIGDQEQQWAVSRLLSEILRHRGAKR